MRYIICDDCGGYYKLGIDESLEDFSKCQCGGNLRYADSFRETVKNRNVPSIICIHCGVENKESDIKCANCGEKLRKISRRISDYHVQKSEKTHINLGDRISFTGVPSNFKSVALSNIS